MALNIAVCMKAVPNPEQHDRPQIAHIATLAGYVHYMLTGVNAVGVGEASGMFPIDSQALDYDAEMLEKFNELVKSRDLPWTLADILPKVLPAGADAGTLTEAGAALLDNLLSSGIPVAPPEGDAGTGMTATSAVAPPHRKRVGGHVHLLHGGAGTAAVQSVRRDRSGDHPHRGPGGYGSLQQLHG